MKNQSVRNGIAELGIIVLGVLIALLAESGWNDYKGRMEGRAYVSRLSTELKINLEYLDNDIKWTQQACNSTETALVQIRGVEAPDQALILRLAVSAATYPSPEYQRVTYDDLIATGNLSLIEDSILREQIVSVYTGFFESISAWRPPKDTDLRKAVVRTLPSEYIVRVIADCLVYPDTGKLSPVLQVCNTIPSSNSPEYWFGKLMSRPDVEGLLSERAWQVCDFGRSMTGIKEGLETLIVKLDTAAE